MAASYDRPVAGNDNYLLDNQQPQAGLRFDALGALFNQWTFRHAERLGLENGWHVWEVGAGGASVPTWFAEQVGPDGHVLATDIDTSWLVGRSSFELMRHDIGTDPAPRGGFHLIHARLVLVHVEERLRALSTMVGALRPGGWLLLEEADPASQPLACIEESGPEEQLANKLKRAFRTLLATRGVDLAFGRKLPRLLRDAGLTEVRADAYFPVAHPACKELELATVEQVRDSLLSAGLATEEEIARHATNVAGGRVDIATSPMFTASGRKPVGSGL